MSGRVSIEDLRFAIDWLNTYDGDETDENNAAAARVAEWLQREIETREAAAVRRQVPGSTMAQARKAIADTAMVARHGLNIGP